MIDKESSTKRKRRADPRHRTAPRRRVGWLPYGLISLGALLLVILFVVFFNQAGNQNVVPPRVGVPLSDFALVDIHGQKVQLSDYSGQVVLVNSWATWCPPCKAEMPDLNAYYQAHQEQGFVILAINAGDSTEAAADFAQSRNLTFPILLDPDLQLLEGFGIHSFPTSILVGRDGTVKNIHIGMYSPEELAANINPLLTQ